MASTCYNIIKLVGRDQRTAVKLAAEALAAGKVIAVPTDTIYGLAVDATNSDAISLLYKIKNRDVKKPLAVCVADVADVSCWGITENLPKGLLEQLIPGAVTVLLTRKACVNEDLNPGINEIGIRVPGGQKRTFIRQVAAELGKPLALTSANSSNEPSCLCVDEFKDLWSLVDIVFDSGRINSKSREGSTIVDLSKTGKYRIVRAGVVLPAVQKIMNQYGLIEWLDSPVAHRDRENRCIQ